MHSSVAEYDHCDGHTIHQEIVDEVRLQMPLDEDLMNVADLFKVFSDSTRVKIISALLKSEMCVCDIAVLLNMSKSAISHQLRTLRQTRIVKTRKDGKVVYYSLDDAHVGNILEQGLDHIRE